MLWLKCSTFPNSWSYFWYVAELKDGCIFMSFLLVIRLEIPPFWQIDCQAGQQPEDLSTSSSLNIFKESYSFKCQLEFDYFSLPSPLCFVHFTQFIFAHIDHWWIISWVTWDCRAIIDQLGNEQRSEICWNILHVLLSAQKLRTKCKSKENIVSNWHYISVFIHHPEQFYFFEPRSAFEVSSLLRSTCLVSFSHS